MSGVEDSILSQITTKLKEAGQEEAQRNYASTIFTLTKSLETSIPSIEEFDKFINDTYDLIIKGDSSKRCSILRVFRYCLNCKEAVKVLMEQEVHYVVVASLEKDGDNAVERMQALKIIEKVLEISPEQFPVAFARSLVAVANSKDDTFRKICIETIRDLSLKNPAIVAAVDGFTPMMDAVLEPITQPMADSIVLALIYLLNDPTTRAIVQHGVDLRALLAPMTDLDSSASELSGKWKASKSALVLLMRSWVGMVQLTADDMAWPTLVRMLKDPKVPLPTQEIILDTVMEIFEPVMSKVKQTNPGVKPRSWGWCDDHDQISSPSHPSMTLSSRSLFAVETKSRPTSEQIPSSALFGLDNKNGIASGGSGKTEPYTVKTPSSADGKKDSTLRASFVWGGNSSNNSSAGDLTSPPGHRKTFSMSNFFNNKDKGKASAPPNLPTVPAGAPAPAVPAKRFSFTGNTTSSSAGGNSGSSNVGKSADDSSLPVSGEMSTLMKIFHLRKRRRAKSKDFGRSDSPTTMSVGSLSNAELRMAGFFTEQEALMDPIFNLMDNYKALLCCAFLHSNLVDSLYFLGVNGASQIAQKSRRLMVNFLRTMAYIFPEDMCSDLLTIPTLIEFAASVSTSRTAKRAHKSSQILISLAEAFTLMPYKQVSGNHTSGLTLSPKQRSSIAGAGGSGAVARGSVTGTPAAVTARANLPPLNIQTIFELAEEIKISSFSTISSGEDTVDGTSSVVAGINGSSTAVEVLNNLRNNLTPEIDKNDFVKQMELSKVIGKEGKEPFKWDWVTICDMLEYSFFNSSRLSEALKTKWVRRVSGFYRCSVEEKGYFANLDWEPIHLQYLECACNMYSVLLKDEAGMNFLTSDRRGMLFNEIAHEIENLTIAAASTNVTAQSASLQRNVFRLYSCQCTMSREFFTLLGRIIHNTGSKHLISGTSVFANLLKLGQYRSLDYVSRLVLTSLSFTDGGVMSRQLLQQWTQKAGCTVDLRTYAHTLLRILLRSGAGLEAFTWRIDAIASQLDSSRSLHTPPLYQALQEAVHDKSNLRAIISKRPKLLDNPNAQKILLRFLSIAEGVEYLSFDKNGERTFKEGTTEPDCWLSDELEAWRSHKCVDYVAQVDELLTLAFAQCDKKIDTISGDPVVQTAQDLQPIPIQTMEFLSELVLRNSNNNSNRDDRGSATNKSVKLSNGDAHTGSENSWYNRDPNANLLIDLHGLVRVPWNVEVKIANSSASTGGVLNGFSTFANGSPSNASATAAAVSTTVIQQSPTGEYLRVDSFLDASYMPSPLCYETCSDPANLIKVRGIILDNRGFPTGHPVPYNKVVSCTLLAGVCPVTRTGKALNPGDVKIQRRKSTVTEGAKESVSRMSSIVPPSNASLAESPLPNGGNSSDLPISYYLDAPYDWTTCKATHRQNNFTELPDGLFSVSVPGEPVVMIFSRRSPSNATSGNNTSSRIGRSSSLTTVPENSSRPPSGVQSAAVMQQQQQQQQQQQGSSVSRASGVVWLVEVQYFFRLETGFAIFVPMPPHIYGELTRTMEGCEIIAKRKVVSDLLLRAKQLYNVCTLLPPSGRGINPIDVKSNRTEIEIAFRDLQAVLWSLGHVISNELGCALVMDADKKFLGWCIENVYTCPYYSLRGTFFYVLGLASRSQQGSRKLFKYGWHCAPRDTNSAVAFPLKVSNMFRSSAVGGFASLPSPRAYTASSGNKFPFSVPPPPHGVHPATPATPAGLPVVPPRAVSVGAKVATDGPAKGLAISTAPVNGGASTTQSSDGYISPYCAGGISSPIRVNTLPEAVLSKLNVFNRSLLDPSKNFDVEVLMLIAKLPGVIVYKECRSRLDHIKRDHPEVFAQRSLYLQVHHMLESYTFKLTARREILALFSDEARLKA